MTRGVGAWRRVGLVVAVLLVVAAMVYVALRAGPLAPTRITVTTVQAGRLQPVIFGVGTVEARRSWMVGPTVAGRVLGVRVDVGDVVQAGQLLAEMDPVDLDERLQALDASVARAISSRSVAAAQVADATARRELAAINARRNQELAAQNFISAGALETRLQERASTEAMLLAAQASLDGSGQDLLRLRAERAALARQRGATRLVAPAMAVVTSRDAEAGSTVVAGQPVLRLMDPGSLWVRQRVDQGRSGGLAPGLPALITLRSRPGQALPGRVVRVEPVADSVTEERIALVAFDVPRVVATAGPSVGEQAEVSLQLPRTAAALLVPNAAVQRSQGTVGVWRMQSGHPEFVAVRLGAHGPDGQVQVLDGLQPGDSIVVYSQKALAAGARVQVVDALVQADVAGARP